MADGYWRYAEARQPPMAQQAAPPAVKRSRSDYDVPVGHELSGYFSREEERVGHRDARDTESLGASYERYLRGQMSSYGAGDPARPLSGGLSSHHSIDDPRIMGVGGIEPGMGGKGRNMGFGGGRSEMPLPPDASNTLFVEGLPSNCTRREVSHIFRPFVGFREVRLVNKESRHGGEPLVLCFVDFTTPAHAAVALDALQVPYWVLYFLGCWTPGLVRTRCDGSTQLGVECVLSILLVKDYGLWELLIVVVVGVVGCLARTRLEVAIWDPESY